mmetsp:Transcript_137818/g.326518  ORF Transcript_137818/g.326518 Transcript_137818/m.326518 type:complete len:275 (+) Transcript_137818:3102-3926(+)
MKLFGDLCQHLFHFQSLLSLNDAGTKLRNVLLHAVDPRLQAAQLAARAHGRGQLLELGCLLKQILPGGHHACLRSTLGVVCLLKGLSEVVTHLPCLAKAWQRSGGLRHLLHLFFRRDNSHLHLLQKVSTLAVSNAAPELLIPITALLQALLQHVHLRLRSLLRAFGQLCNLHQLPRHEALRLHQRRLDLSRHLLGFAEKGPQVLVRVILQEGQLRVRHLLQLVFGVGDLVRNLLRDLLGHYAPLRLLKVPPNFIQLLLRRLATLLQCLQLLDEV